MLKESTLDPPETLGVLWALLRDLLLWPKCGQMQLFGFDKGPHYKGHLWHTRVDGKGNTGKWGRIERHFPCCCVWKGREAGILQSLITE